ncbi:MAG: methyl-accepting chemotaxis protein [Chloroflexi bacterium]|nr:methyl-accepting chemotaxis protein [Chloroflexota bacterium]
MNDLHKWWRQLTMPHTADANEALQEYMTRVILVILNVVGLGFFVYFFIGAIFGMSSWQSLIPTIVIDLLFFGGWSLARRGHWRLASYLSPMAFFGLALSTNYLNGLGAVAMLQYAIVVIMVAILQGGGLEWAALGMSVGAYLIMGWMHVQGNFPSPPDPENKFGEWGGPVAGMLTFITILLWFYTRQFRHTLLQTNRAQVEVEERAEAEQEQRERLLRLNEKAKERAAVEEEERKHLQSIFVQIREVASHLGAIAAEILAATTQQASGASEQSAAIAQTTTTVDELKTIAGQSVSRAQEVAGASQRTVEVSHAGRQAVQNTIGSMGKIRSQVEGIAENILALSEQTQQVGEIIATVNDIAAQSNILALNASVEAARAGEYGKGFAVVAVEVRNLAEQSRQATAQVRAILSDIQKATNVTVMATEEGTKGVDEGVHLAAQAQAAIEQLGAVIEESAQAATQMVAGGRQQSAGVEQVAVAMQNINQATVQSLASTRQAEKAARELNELDRSLAAIVDQYQL